MRALPTRQVGLRARATGAPEDGAWPLLVFFVLAFAFSWAWWVPLAITEPPVRRGVGWPTHLPGLLGPMAAAFIVLALTQGRRGVGTLWRAMRRRPDGLQPRLAVLSPLVFLGLGLIVSVVAGDPPSLEEFGEWSGVAPGLLIVGVALIVGAYGEEAGWRGYALPRLQARLGPLRATIALAAAWALWHVPLFFVLASYAGFSAFTLAGFVIGLSAGALVLTSIYNGTGGSVLAVVVWHVLYNFGAGTSAGDPLIASVMTGCVIFWAVSLVQRERSGQPALGRPAPAP